MKLKVVILSAVLSVAFACSVLAQTSRVAYVDIDRVTEKSDKINKAMGNVSDRVEGIQKDIETKRKRLADLKMEIKKGEGVIADTELKKKRDESSQIEKDLVDLEYQGRRELQKLDATLFEPMIKTIVLAIQEVAKERNIDLVVRGEAVIYGADAADITDEVIKKLNSPSFNPGAKSDSSSSATRTDKDSGSDAGADKSSASDDKSAPAKSASGEKSASSEKSSAASAEKDSGSKSIIPNIPLRSRPVDRQQD